MDEDNLHGWLFMADLLSEREKTSDECLYPVGNDIPCENYIDIVDEAISYMYMYADEEELKSLSGNAPWSDYRYVLTEEVWDECDIYIDDIQDLVEMPWVDEISVMNIVNNFLRGLLK